MNSDVNMNELQSIELEMLMAVDAVCSSLNIKYFLVGGTLLGAVRHKGFIPWDDDIDIGMLREDYEIFIKKAQDLLPNYLFVQNFKTDSEVPFNFTKIRDSRTTFIQTTLKKIKMNHGVFIDVFPIDYYPENKLRARLTDMFISFMGYRFFNVYFHIKKPRYSGVKYLLCFLLSILFRKTKNAVIAKESLIKSQKKSQLMKNFSGVWGKREIVPAECFKNFIRLEFEGRQLMAPAAYDLYLRHIYGEYMTLPPVEKRVAHHYAEIIDLMNPYTKYLT